MKDYIARYRAYIEDITGKSLLPKATAAAKKPAKKPAATEKSKILAA